MTTDRDRRGPRADDGQEPRILALPSGRTSTLRGELEVLVAAQRAAADSQGPRVHVSIDVPPDAQAAGHPALVDAMARVLSAAFATAVCPDPASDLPHVAEVVITAVATGTGLELEIASSGCPSSASDAEIASAAAVLERSGGAIVATPCPEGGRALTLRLPRRAARRQAA